MMGRGYQHNLKEKLQSEKNETHRNRSPPSWNKTARKKKKCCFSWHNTSHSTHNTTPDMTIRLLPEVEPLTLLYTIFHEKGSPFGRRLPAAVPVLGHYREYPPGLLDDQSLVHTGSRKPSIAVHCLCWKNDLQSEKKQKMTTAIIYLKY